MTPSPVSRAVKSLEDDLGVQLFIRRHHSLTLTAAGQILLTGATSVVRQLDDLKRSVVAAASREDTPVVAGGSPFAPTEVFDQITERVRLAAGGRTVHIEFADWEKFPERISRGEMDLAVLNLPFHHRAVDHLVVADLALGVAMRSDDALAGKGSVTWQDLRRHRLVIPRRTRYPSSLTAVRDQIEHAQTCDIDEVIAPDVVTLAAQVRSSHGRVFLAMPATAGGPWKVLDDPAFTVVPLRADAPTFSICLAWSRQRHQQDSGYAAFIDEVAAPWAHSDRSAPNRPGAEC